MIGVRRGRVFKTAVACLMRDSLCPYTGKSVTHTQIDHFLSTTFALLCDETR